MDDHIRIMRRQWEINSETFRDRIGMTGRRPSEEEFQQTVRDLAVKIRVHDPGIRGVLDVGCNNGYLMKCLNPAASEIIGVDFCHLPLQDAQNINPAMRYVQGEITRLPFSDRRFDRVLCYNMFHYLPDMETALTACRELFRVLASGGRMVIGDLFTIEHRHLIPEADQTRWNSPDRPLMHQMKNWLFVSATGMVHLFTDLAAHRVDLQPQAGDIRCPGYRYDLIVDK
ncbi:class I SAM-dependent methyltransferase [bacterium]|nr:class I SAM-dependent methyltransferase [candidate division CSSED10-310 bacterium]